MSAVWAAEEGAEEEVVLQVVQGRTEAMVGHLAVEEAEAEVASREALAGQGHVDKSWLSPTSRMGK